MKNKWIKKTLILLLWILLWQLIAIFVNNSVYFASPADTLKELALQGRTAAFWQSVAGSLIRITGGFFIASFFAFALAFLSYFVPLSGEILSPLINFLKSVPVAAVVVILLIWWGSEHLVLCISFMVVFPNVYENMLTGLKKTDRKLLEMAKVFGMGFGARFLWIYREAYRPYLLSAMSVSLGMAFKSGIAAEIIGLPAKSIGERLYRDKIYLNTAGVFAWIITILFISFVTEKIILLLLRTLEKLPAPCPKVLPVKKEAEQAAHYQGGADIEAEGLKKSYNERQMINCSIKLKAGGVYFLDAPSGRGKTTLLHIIAGIEKSDEGSVKCGRISMVFQDDRLIGNANALRNLELAGCRGDLAEEIKKVLPERVFETPASKLSGGEKRRLSILRALLHPSDILLMDEPFAGLDEETRLKMTGYIKSNQNGRTLLIAGHDTQADLEDMVSIGGQVWKQE
ncbi:MAG: ATP-binding cassette domain-containing protein [Lachnospiraceae bacterium]|nr:ATP-binding cassette domain-containing protein [Lachnospiraceae bacterium]